jgi:hypothetical protein
VADTAPLSALEKRTFEITGKNTAKMADQALKYDSPVSIGASSETLWENYRDHCRINRGNEQQITWKISSISAADEFDDFASADNGEFPDSNLHSPPERQQSRLYRVCPR